jgi:hypothetical protein
MNEAPAVSDHYGEAQLQLDGTERGYHADRDLVGDWVITLYSGATVVPVFHAKWMHRRGYVVPTFTTLDAAIRYGRTWIYPEG